MVSFLDDDWIGFVFGFKEPNDATSYDDYDFWLFDWKKAWQEVGGGWIAQEGFSLCKVDGHIAANNDIYKYFWAHTNDSIFQVVDSLWGSGYGWTRYQEYRFELSYTSTRIIIVIDWDTIFDINGCFEEGRFGFYNYSQQDVLFEDLKYRQKIDFSHTKSCVGKVVDFISIDTNCSTIPPNLVNWSWDFGTGDSSNMMNPQYAFPDTGAFNVNLIVEDNLGCTDSITKVFNVLDSPNVITFPTDTIVCVGDSVLLTATGGSNYFWSTGSMTNTIIVSTPSDTTISYYVTVTDNNGCSGFDTVRVTFDPCVSLADLTFEPRINIFPNPTTGKLKIQISKLKNDVEMRITNLHGQIMLNDNFTINSPSYIKEIDLSMLPKGIYFINFRSGNFVRTEKLLVK